ncbi:hypothetical protein JZ751_019853 [Albula glossodonta]|uniref:Palmitoyltransferase n=1 Tax=Albula glossodonta TaxID=121402 RepID=A0A8T2NLJ5_9TELE|nr:hypothetical protein JZ751_019853 [Albula glossodonta]
MLPVTDRTEYEHGDIFDIIQKGNIDQCAHIIQLDRSTLKQKGWSGFTPLHYAAYQGNRALADLLLCNGADANTPCDAGLTPFHFACRNGNIYIIHQMLQHGADLRIVDHQGKTALHHSVAGGNIFAMQYLNETGMFSFADTDKFQITPLHLAASTGNTDVIRYLLRNNRCPADAMDQQGVTALHIAAEKGAAEVSWLLLQEAGLRILHLKNRNGLTPLDLCRQGTTFRHVLLDSHVAIGLRRCYSAHSRGTWGLRVDFLPAALPLVWEKHSLTVSQDEQLSGASSLEFSATALLHVSVVHFIVVLWMFWKVLTKDPGRLQQGDADPRFSSIMSLVEANQNPSKFCIYCEIFQPDGCKHCRLCNICVLEYDHHCLFLNHCVGRNNHRLFVVFILGMAAAHLIFISSAAYYLFTKYSGPSRPAWAAILESEAWVLVLLIMNFFTVIWECWLLTEQFEAISMGTTTYFKRCESERRPLWQRWGTVLSFLLEGKRTTPRQRRSSIAI